MLRKLRLSGDLLVLSSQEIQPSDIQIRAEWSAHDIKEWVSKCKLSEVDTICASIDLARFTGADILTGEIDEKWMQFVIRTNQVKASFTDAINQLRADYPLDRPAYRMAKISALWFGARSHNRDDFSTVCERLNRSQPLLSGVRIVVSFGRSNDLCTAIATDMKIGDGKYVESDLKSVFGLGGYESDPRVVRLESSHIDSVDDTCFDQSYHNLNSRQVRRTSLCQTSNAFDLTRFHKFEHRSNRKR